MNRDLPDGRYSQLDVRETVATSGAEIYAADTERKICSASAYCGTQHRRASLETLVWDAYSSASISKAALRALPLSAEGAERNEILKILFVLEAWILKYESPVNSSGLNYLRL